MDRITSLIKQYRYGLLILVLGLGLMLLPQGGSQEVEHPPATEAAEATVEEKLAAILSRMEGVGKAEVMLTLALGPETIYESREDQTDSGDSGSSHREPVIISDENRAEQGLIQQVISPVYRGAIVVCQGGGNAAVKLAIVEAVSDVTGLTADKITVLKMK